MQWLHVLTLSSVLIFVTLAFETKNGSQKFSGDKDDKCFCKLQGEVDDCSCKVETLDSLNNKKIYPRLKSLLTRDYFRYFKVHLSKNCPFWTDDSRCALKDCHVDTCSEDEVPPALKAQGKENKYSEEAQKEHTCQEERELSALDTTISDESKEAFKNWTEHDDSQDMFCEIDDENSVELEYVDLSLNPERYTGYKGDSPHRIWRSIYEENCFKPETKYRYGTSTKLANNDPDWTVKIVCLQLEDRALVPVLSATCDRDCHVSRLVPLREVEVPYEDMCLEKRAFYRMVSGLHTSINIHLCADYLFQSLGYGAGHWGPNTDEFKKRFDPLTSDGEGPQRLKNLYFTYLVELRALAKAAPYMEQELFYTGSEAEDSETQKGVQDLLQIIRSFKDHFDESKLFADEPVVSRKLKEEFRNHFRNISRIMDCVGCDKCKLWGKLQVQGMGTALKILFSGDALGPESTVNASSKKTFQLTRSEIVSLFNAFGRLSKSIHSLEMFRKMLS